MLRPLFVASALIVQVVSAQSAARTSGADSALIGRVLTAETGFFAHWRAAWMRVIPPDSAEYAIWQRALRENYAGRRGLRAGFADDLKYQAYMAVIRRTYAILCPTNPDYPGVQAYAGLSRMIRSSTSLGGLCPDWTYERGVPGHTDADSLAATNLTPALRAERRLVIALVDSAAELIPGNGWLTGQQVRLRLDDARLREAFDLARACRTSKWWCSSLAGLVLSEMGDARAADSAFMAGINAMSADARCTWTDIAVLLPPNARNAYIKLPCRERDAVSTSTWWLADPLFAVAGNERRAEHYSRRMSLALRSAVPIDQLYRWQLGAGADALAEMITRYGWPSKSYWQDTLADQAGDTQRRVRKYAPASPYLRPEYSRGRVHLLPSWNAIRSPFDAVATDWSLNEDGDGWWPTEFFAPKQPFFEFDGNQFAFLRRDSLQVVQSSDDQSVALRRDHDVLFAFATNLSSVNFGQGPNDSAFVVLSVSSSPDSIARVASRTVKATSRVAMRAPIAPRPAIVAFEIPNEDGALAAVRTRFAIRPPPSLDKMSVNDRAISDPVLIETDAARTALPNDPDLALPRMLGSTRLSTSTKAFGVYWETYGFAPTDSVEVSIHLDKQTISWGEPQAGHASFAVHSRVPIVARSVILDVSTLHAGTYPIQISVRKPGMPAVTSRKQFTIR